MWQATKGLVLIAVLAAVALVAVPGAAASAPTEATGTFTTTSATFNSMREVGGQHDHRPDLDGRLHRHVHGHLDGARHLDLPFGRGRRAIPAVEANFHDVEVFTGTVNGVPGTVTFNLNGSSDPTAAVKATDTIVSATGDLAGLRGVLSQDGTVGPGGPVGTYTGQIQFGSP